jgi:hypothetical protein
MISPISSAQNAAYLAAPDAAPKAPAKPPAKPNPPQDTVHLSAKATAGKDADHDGD